MGIEHKHAYRFGYLKSEEWQTLRIAALAAKDAKCKLCSKRSLSNDVHHIYYPPSFWDTKVEDVVILCRKCHELIHSIMDLESLPKSKERGRCFEKFRLILEAFQKWRKIERKPKPIDLSKAENRAEKIAAKLAKLRPCFRCKSEEDLAFVEVCPAKPTPSSKWSLCGKCRQLFEESKIEGFKAARVFAIDFRKSMCKKSSVAVVSGLVG